MVWDEDLEERKKVNKYIVGVCRTGGLNRATSKFISARLGPDGVQSGYKDVYWFGHERPYIQWGLLLLVLPYTGVLVVGVTSFRERERIPSLFWGMVHVR
jgi:hypothetical protein